MSRRRILHLIFQDKPSETILHICHSIYQHHCALHLHHIMDTYSFHLVQSHLPMSVHHSLLNWRKLGQLDPYSSDSSTISCLQVVLHLLNRRDETICYTPCYHTLWPLIQLRDLCHCVFLVLIGRRGEAIDPSPSPT